LIDSENQWVDSCLSWKFGLIDIQGSERTEYMRQTNANMLVLCQLESARAFDNLDAILEVKGFDGYVFGPNDLAQSMGYPGKPEHPVVQEAQNAIGERIHAAGRHLSSDLHVAIGLIDLILSGSRDFLAWE